MTESPPGWTLGALRAIARVEYGKGLRASDREASGNIPVFGSSGIVGRHSEALVVEPAVVIGRKGNAGKCFVSPGPSWPIDTTYFVRVPPEIDPWFLGYQLELASLAALDSSTAIPSLLRPALEATSVALAPLNEQRRIVAAIEEHTSRLDAAETALADALRRVSALANARIEAATEGHPLVELGAVTTAHRYGTSVKCSPSGEVAVLRIPNVRGGKVDTSDLKFATSRDLGDCHVECGDLLIIRTNGSRALIGRAAVVDGAADGMAFASYLIRVRPTADLDPEWCAMALSSPKLRREIESRAPSTAGQHNLNLTAIRSLPLPLPHLDEQCRIVARLAEERLALQALGAALDQARRRSASLRRALLDRAMSGNLVPQDPCDEPASTLLERIRTQRAAASPGRSRRRKVGT